MARIPVDFSGVNVGGAIFPVGSFRAKIESAELVNAKSSGNPMIKVRFASIHPGVLASQYSNYVLVQNSLFNLKRLLLATGDWTEDDLNGLFDVDTDDLVGLEVGIVVEPAVDQNGKATTNIARAIPIEDVTGPAEAGVTPIAGVGESAAADLGKLF